jgi:nucleoside-diphosphate-sugar epimerase
MKNIYHLSLMNFSQKKFYSINFLVKNIKKIINSKIKVVHNMKLNNASSTRKVDNNKFLKKFSNFQFTNLENGIAETIKYYKKRLFNY